MKGALFMVTETKVWRLEDLGVGMAACASQYITAEKVWAYAKVTGDWNPVNFDETYASRTIFKGRIAHGGLVVADITRLIGMELPGNGSVVASSHFKFIGGVKIGATVLTKVKVARVDITNRFVRMDCCCSVEGTVVVEGHAMIYMLFMLPEK
jgi:3-hydroxybutyryl-CoA dehydratase